MSRELRILWRRRAPARIHLSGAPESSVQMPRRASTAGGAGLAVGGGVDVAGKVEARLADWIQHVDREIARRDAEVAAQVAALEPQLVELSMEVASKVMRKEIDSGSFDFTGAVREGLERITAGLRDPRPIELFVNEKAAQRIGALIEEREPDEARVNLAVDPELGAGACRIRCGDRMLRLDPELMLSRIRDELAHGGVS